MTLIFAFLPFAFFFIIYVGNVAGDVDQNYIDIKTGKILSAQISNVTSTTLLDCAGKCMELEPKGTCNLAGFNKSSNNCQLGSQGNATLQDVPDQNSVVMELYKLVLGYDCCDIHANLPSAPSGIYKINTLNKTVISVYCDMDTTCGGWTVIQNRFDGSVNFTETFFKYEYGFGSVDAEHWLGLKYIQEIAAKGPTTLRFDLESADGTTGYEEHTNFFLSAGPDYTLSLNPIGTGTAGYSPGMSYNSGFPFVTIDRENAYNCAHQDFGGWWYYNCAYVNLNGKYMTPGDLSLYESAVTYRTFKNCESLKKTKMMISRCCA